jgi:phospholipase/lecithinase/hemolysin
VTDVSIYVALITGAAGAIGATVPQLATVFGENRRAKRDREERGVSARQQAYVELLGAAADFRTRVANTAMYGGDEILVRLAEIRSSAAEVDVKAAKVAFVADGLATPAGTVASETAKLAADAIQMTNTTTGVMITPSFVAFDAAVAAFRSASIGSAKP